MRYTKIALLTFGAGLLLGLVVVVLEIDRFDRVASGLMAAGLFAVPVGMIVDWRLATRPGPVKRRAKAPAGRAPAASWRAPRPRRPAPRKR
ncbi:MAG TPA: hypothetical protein VMF05_05745 [Stellaceae bacterium]|nr:hypothetical protein [Stellaceae bacterium]